MQSECLIRPLWHTMRQQTKSTQNTDNSRGTASMRRAFAAALALVLGAGARAALRLPPLPGLGACLRALPRTYERVLLRAEANLTRAEEARAGRPAQPVRVENLWLF